MWSVSEPSLENAQPVAGTASSKKNSSVIGIEESHTSHCESTLQVSSPTEPPKGNYNLRFLGSDLFSANEEFDKVVHNFHMSTDPRRYTPLSGCHLGRSVEFFRLNNRLRHEPSRTLVVSLPGFGTQAGGRHSCKVLQNIGQLVLTQLEDPRRHILIDGARGNPAWNQEVFTEVIKHPRLKFFATYFWCAAGVSCEGKPHRRRSMILSSFPINHLNEWKNCCGKKLEEHSVPSQIWRTRSRRHHNVFPLEVLSGIMTDITEHHLALDNQTKSSNGSASRMYTNTANDQASNSPTLNSPTDSGEVSAENVVGVVNYATGDAILAGHRKTGPVFISNEHNTSQKKAGSSLKEEGKSRENKRPKARSTDIARSTDNVTIDERKGEYQRPIRVKFNDKVEVRSFPLHGKKNKKPVTKRDIPYPDDPEKGAQGQDADCGEDFTSIDEDELKTCEFREDCLTGKQLQPYPRKQSHLTAVYWNSCYERDMKLLSELDIHFDYTYFSVGLRGSGFTDDHVEKQDQHVQCFHSVLDEEAFVALTSGKSVDTLEFF